MLPASAVRDGAPIFGSGSNDNVVRLSVVWELLTELEPVRGLGNELLQVAR